MYRPVLVLGLIALVSLPAAAQGNRVGIGVSIEPLTRFAVIDQNGFSSLGFFTPSLYVPITLGQFRLEPEISYVRDAVSLNDETTANSRLRFVTGLFYYNQRSEANALYVGTRIGFARTAVSNAFSDDTASQIDFIFAPTLGGEHYFGDLSLGVESQVQYTRIGNVDEDSEVTRSQFLIRALFFARFHF
ncbi:MAG: hypothetical protein AAF089_06385 [Bacteroidota bacterium]